MSAYLQEQIIQTQNAIRVNNSLISVNERLKKSGNHPPFINPDDEIEHLEQQNKVLGAQLAVFQSQARPKDV